MIEISEIMQAALDSFGNALLYPLRTDATFFAYLSFSGAEGLWQLAAFCALAATLGHGVNYALGLLLRLAYRKEVFYLNDALYEKAQRFGWLALPPLLLFSWGSLGALPPLVAGFLGLPFWLVLSCLLLGQGLYYLYFIMT